MLYGKSRDRPGVTDEHLVIVNDERVDLAISHRRKDAVELARTLQVRKGLQPHLQCFGAISIAWRTFTGRIRRNCRSVSLIQGGRAAKGKVATSMRPSIIVWDLETVPNLGGFAAATIRPAAVRRIKRAGRRLLHTHEQTLAPLLDRDGVPQADGHDLSVHAKDLFVGAKHPAREVGL